MAIMRQTQIKNLGYIRDAHGDLEETFYDLDEAFISVRDEAFARLSSNQIGRKVPPITTVFTRLTPRNCVSFYQGSPKNYKGVESIIGDYEGGTITSMALFWSSKELPVLLKQGMNEFHIPILARDNYKYQDINCDRDFFWEYRRYDDYGDKATSVIRCSELHYESAREQAESEKHLDFQQRTALVLPSSEKFRISPIINSEVYRFLFEDVAEKYWGKFAELYKKQGILIEPNAREPEIRREFLELGLYFMGETRFPEYDESLSFKGVTKWKNARGIFRKGDNQIIENELNMLKRNYRDFKIPEWDGSRFKRQERSEAIRVLKRKELLEKILKEFEDISEK